MLVVVEQYNTQEVYVHPESVNSDANTILKYILSESKEYDTLKSVTDLEMNYESWLYRMESGQYVDSTARHFKVDMYEDSTELSTYKKSIIVYYHPYML